MREIYFDYNGSAPADPRVIQTVTEAMSTHWGNASAVHRFGRRQVASVDMAREQVASLVGGRPADVVFTAGATEANNLALCGAVLGAGQQQPRVLVSAVEHSSVRKAAFWLRDHGLAKVEVVPVTAGGFVEPDEVERRLDSDVLLVSVMAANSETGVLNPVREISARVHSAGALFHCDVTQMVGRLPFDMIQIGADLVSFSSHKICGPGGVGALVGTRRSLRQLRPVVHGGGHEKGLRSGSLNVAGIVGFGTASAISLEEQYLESTRVERLRDRLVHELRDRLDAVYENGDVACRLPNTASLRFAGSDGEAVLMNMGSVAASTGSACNSGSLEPSAVLLAMGLSRESAYESVRFSLGRFTTYEDVTLAVPEITAAVEHVRASVL